MNSREIFDLGIKMGMKADPRGLDKAKRQLSRTKKKYQEMGPKDKEFFDLEKLENPYSDSRILFSSKRKSIKKVLAGIDIGGAEILVAKHLGDIDLIISHHPQGAALADLSDVMLMQAQVLADYGLPINIAESVIKPRLSEVSRSTISGNYNRNLDIAKVLDLDFMCLHTALDNLAADYLQKIIKNQKNKLETVGDLLDLLKTIPEYKIASEYKAGPVIFSGNRENSLGRIALTEITGGTSGAKNIYEKMSHYGFGTVIGMHMEEEHRKEAEKYHINVVIAGHMSSDSLGINLFLDQLEKKGLEVVPLGGLIRVKRS